MERLKNPKLLAAAVVALLAVIVFFQNQDTMTLKVLFLYEVTTSEAKALATAFVFGLVTGALAFSRWKSQREKAKARDTSAA
jgi:hypothetical protein